MAAVALQLALLHAASAAHAQAPAVGRVAPGFALSTVNGDSIRLSQFHGHPVVVNFWATWCPSCRAELPAFAAAREAHVDVGLQVITVNGEQTVSQIRHFLSRLPPQAATGLIHLVDSHHRVGDRYYTPGLPSTYFIDSAGIVRGIHYGELGPAELAVGLRSILSPHNQE